MTNTTKSVRVEFVISAKTDFEAIEHRSKVKKMCQDLRPEHGSTVSRKRCATTGASENINLRSTLYARTKRIECARISSGK